MYNFAFYMLLLWHTIDVMHVEKNISVNMLGHVVGDKDTIAVRQDMVHRDSHSPSATPT
jgi:hypothetical protein